FLTDGMMPGPGDNRKAAGTGRNDPEPLKRAVATCVRALSGDREMEVTFSREKPGMTGNLVRLPELPRKPTRRDVAVTRGLGDSMALRQACHDKTLHARLAPTGAQARS